MKFVETALPDAFVLELEQHRDDRGFFARAFCEREFAEHGLVPHVVQSNVSYNHVRGTLRGMHFQHPPHAETKLVRCTAGAIHDVIVDLRRDSPTYKRWIGIDLTADNRRMLYVPRGFAHGFVTLEDRTEVTYHVSEFYTPGAEGGLRWNDPAFDLRWPVAPQVISDKDRSWPDYGA